MEGLYAMPSRRLRQWRNEHFRDVCHPFKFMKCENSIN